MLRIGWMGAGAFLLVPASPQGLRFVDVAAEAGLDFVHYNGVTDEK